MERTLLSAAFDFALDFDSRANCPARSEATQPDSSWVSGRGAPEPWPRKEQSDDRSHGEGAGGDTTSDQNKSGPPQAARWFELEASS